MDMQVVGGATSGSGSYGPSCCLSAEHQIRGHRMSSLSRSLRQGVKREVCEYCWRAISVMSGLFLHNCITPTSPNCINVISLWILLTVLNIWILCIGSIIMKVLMSYDYLTLSSTVYSMKRKHNGILLRMRTFPAAYSNYLIKEIMLT